ncbi:MAG: hypothetical protein K8R53_02160 [Bacteroidales bacterium]|nr:hypothetical protein [Bacteroidales bacterium]
MNYALFCSKENHLPLYFDVYQGNVHDSMEFKKILPGFKAAFKDKITPGSSITIIFDKGNNSPVITIGKQKTSYWLITANTSLRIYLKRPRTVRWVAGGR